MLNQIISFNKISALLSLSILFLFTFDSLAQDKPDYALSPENVCPLQISSIIPDVSVKNPNGKNTKLRDIAAQQPTILIFYRGGWCPYCSRHLSELQVIDEKLNQLGYQVVAISADRPEKLRESIDESNLSYKLFSDSPMTASKAFGLAFKVKESTVKRYMEIGIDLEGDSGYNHHLLPVPAVYILNKEGIVRYKYVNPNYKERINGKVLLAAAEAYLDSE